MESSNFLLSISQLYFNSTVEMEDSRDYNGSSALILLGPLLQVVGSLLLHPLTPAYLTSNSRRSNKWRATHLARLSAAISGLWALLALYDSLPLRRDLMFGSSELAVNLIIFSIGVHVAEVLDMLITRQFSLLSIHHLAVIICFSGALLTGRSLGFAVITLITELNAVTNKTRILHIISQKDNDCLEYQLNAYLNICTFFIRILIIFWMNNQAFQYFSKDPCIFFGCCSAGLLFVNMWNLSVFKVLVDKDIIRSKKLQ